jgi:hypothetical protein
MVLVDSKAHPERVQIIRCDIKPRSVVRTRDVENEPISEEKLRDTLRPNFSHTAMFS